MLPFNITNPGITIANLPTSQEAQYLTNLVLAGSTASENDVLTWKSGAPSWEPLSASSLPDQTGNSGKYLTTNGLVASWATISGGGDMLSTNNLSDVTNVATARTNLGLGSAAQAATTDFAPALGTDDNYVTDAEKAALHTHSNKAVLDATTASFTTADETKLDGIEAGADVTDTANVTAAGALMDSEVTNLAAVKAFDPTDYAAALGADDNYVTDAEKTKLGNISVTQPVDLDNLEERMFYYSVTF
jgi:Cu/Ag efflux protein CusF